MHVLKDLTDSDFNLFRRLIYEQSGISLNPSKRELLRTRLRARLEREKFTSYREYYKFVVDDKTGKALVPLLDDISTNLTSFYREKNHFDYLNQILPEWIKRKKKEGDNTFRIWSAGCSTGEEPYTLAFTMLPYVSNKSANMSLKILATDLSTDVLGKAAEGVYRLDRTNDIPANVKKDYFIGEQGEKGKSVMRVHPMVRELITFRRFNLMSEQFPFKNRFDYIFCRNVMIYFDKPTQETLVAKYYNVLKPGGYLFVGHSESLTTIKHSFDYIMPTIYRK